jgi:hypothetical protein
MYSGPKSLRTKARTLPSPECQPCQSRPHEQDCTSDVRALLKADPKEECGSRPRTQNVESGGNLVTHAAVAEGAGKFFRVQLLGKAKVDAAGIVEDFDLVG